MQMGQPRRLISSMKRFQLFARNKNWETKKPSIQQTYPEASLLGLPEKLFDKIVEQLDTATLISLSSTCRRLHSHINQNFLYRHVRLKDKRAVYKFSKLVKKVPHYCKYVESVEFVDPVMESSESTMIGGTFSFKTNSSTQPYVELMMETLRLLPSVRHVMLTELKSHFVIPPQTEKIHRLEKLTLAGNKTLLRAHLLWWCEGTDELELRGLTINEESLATPQQLTLLKYAVDGVIQYRYSPVQSLVLNHCNIKPARGITIKLAKYFSRVRRLQLLDMLHPYDLLLAQCFNLNHLTVDLNSHCFTHFQLSQDIVVRDDASIHTNDTLKEMQTIYYPEQDVNGMPAITQKAMDYFENMGIPRFHIFYHYFRPLFESLPTTVSLTVLNIPFTNITPKQAAKDSVDQQTLLAFDEDIYRFKDIPNNNCYNFFQFLSKYNSQMEIVLLRKWMFCTPRTRFDWELLLKPLLNGRLSVKVRDNDGFVMYSYGVF